MKRRRCSLRAAGLALMAVLGGARHGRVLSQESRARGAVSRDHGHALQLQPARHPGSGG